MKYMLVILCACIFYANSLVNFKHMISTHLLLFRYLYFYDNKVGLLCLCFWYEMWLTKKHLANTGILGFMG